MRKFLHRAAYISLPGVKKVDLDYPSWVQIGRSKFSTNRLYKGKRFQFGTVFIGQFSVLDFEIRRLKKERKKNLN